MRPTGPTLGELLAGLPRVLVVRDPWVDPAAVDALVRGLVPRSRPPATWRVAALDDHSDDHSDDRTGDQTGDHSGDPPGSDAVVLVLRDRLALRRVVGACHGLPATSRVGCVLLGEDAALLTAGRPSWPPVVAVSVAVSPVSFTLVELARPLPAGSVVADLARRTTPAHLMASGWPALGLDLDAPDLWTSGDPVALVGPRTEIVAADGDYPADLLVLGGAGGPGRQPVAHPVLGPLADDLRLGSGMSWEEHDRLGADAAERVLRADRGLGLGGLDGRLLTPAGFRRRPTDPPQDLRPVASPAGDLEVSTVAGPVLIDSRAGVGPAEVARLRGLEAVHVGWRGGHGPRAHARAVAALALAGVPLTCDPVPGWARALLHPSLVVAIEDPGGTGDPMAREVRSIRLRRAARDRHSDEAWRAALAAHLGLPPAPRPRVSVLLATRRPDQLGFALRQVRRQRGVEVEVVLAAHGWQPDDALVEELRGEVAVEIVDLPADLAFGSVLNAAAARASGDLLLKMDDDDWYGRDFVADLLAARSASGADVVGTPPEFIYLEQLDVTVRRKDATECFRPVVAGGTLLVSRSAFDALGGFRPLRRYVDAGLLRAVAAAGGSTYRAHGHGYVLRRGPSGHTWDPGLGYFVSRSRTSDQWRGFRPSPLLEPDDIDLPRTAGATDA